MTELIELPRAITKFPFELKMLHLATTMVGLNQAVNPYFVAFALEHSGYARYLPKVASPHCAAAGHPSLMYFFAAIFLHLELQRLMQILEKMVLTSCRLPDIYVRRTTPKICLFYVLDVMTSYFPALPL